MGYKDQKASWEARKKIICELVNDSIYVPMKEKELAAFMQRGQRGVPQYPAGTFGREEALPYFRSEICERKRTGPDWYFHQPS